MFQFDQVDSRKMQKYQTKYSFYKTNVCRSRVPGVATPLSSLVTWSGHEHGPAPDIGHVIHNVKIGFNISTWQRNNLAITNLIIKYRQ